MGHSLRARIGERGSIMLFWDDLNQLVQSDTMAPGEISSSFIFGFNWEYILNVFPIKAVMTLEIKGEEI